MKKKTSKDWNDLPRYSSWPARLISNDPEQKHKNRAELHREYEKEKWGPLLTDLKGKKLTLRRADLRSVLGSQPQPCWVHGKLDILSAMDALDLYRKMVQRILLPHLGKATAVVELGAGYGAIILWLAKQPSFRSIPCFAGEFAESGRKLMGDISLAERIPLTIGNCDYYDPKVTDLDIPPGALIFTSMSCCCLPQLPPTLLGKLAKLKPSRVIHLEPIKEHYDLSTLMGLMQQHYLSVNDYNQNLFSLLQAGKKSGLLKVIDETPMFFGMNPILPCSMIAWKPNLKSVSLKR